MSLPYPEEEYDNCVATNSSEESSRSPVVGVTEQPEPSVTDIFAKYKKLVKRLVLSVVVTAVTAAFAAVFSIIEKKK